MRASSWASTTTRRARSVNRSNMRIAPWTLRAPQTCSPHDRTTLLPAYVFRGNDAFAVSEHGTGSDPEAVGSRPGLHQAVLVGEHDRLDPVAEPELAQHLGDVRLHRLRGDVQGGRDLGVGSAPGELVEDLALARAQGVQRRRTDRRPRRAG